MKMREPAPSGSEPHSIGAASPTQCLSQMRRGGLGRILAVRGSDDKDQRDIERGLLEMGFVEGAAVEVLHYGLLGRDPLAVRINQTMTVALRRREADAVLVGPLLEPVTNAGPVVLECAPS
ncbi:MAG: FeoA family protein [Candidatus Competibacter sp.]